jgi:1-pyrroline-5-carboxylate dehydrogenase
MNEPVLGYAPKSPERVALKAALESAAKETLDIPLWIGGKEIRTGKTFPVVMPHAHAHVLARMHEAQTEHVEKAIEAAQEAKPAWSAMPFHDRAAIFLRAAELLAQKHRARVNAATMLGQSKVAHQAEIDSACEAIDFLRFNVAFAERILAEQPESSPGIWNQTDYRPLDGFVLAVAPFNFTAIALNLCTAPALMGNTVLLKPSHTASLSNWALMQVLKEAGLPDGVINFVPGDGPTIGNAVLASPHFAGLHFTGSTRTFNLLWKQMGEGIARYRQYPRIVGETGGKDFIFIHASAAGDLDALATAVVRGSFEYQGQKCSASSRVYVPDSVWPKLKARIQEQVSGLRMGDVRDFRNFMGAVIDEASFKRAQSYLELAKGAEASVVTGGNANGKDGYFVEPTVVQVTNPRHRLMSEEIFAPIVGVYVYPEAKYEETLKLCDETAPYALTGAVFARDRQAIRTASHALRHAAGNFYINDKPTGAVVGQQPFGGSRGSGTNDKAGSALNLLRWTSARTIKETFVPPTQPGYAYMSEE